MIEVLLALYALVITPLLIVSFFFVVWLKEGGQ